MRAREKAATCDPDLPGAELAPSGAWGGMVAAVVGTLSLALQTRSTGVPWERPFQLVSAGVVRSDPSGSPVLFAVLGVSGVFVFAVAMGAVFSYLIRCRVVGDRSQVVGDRAMVAGALFGTAVWGAVTFGVLPWMNPVLRDYASVEPVGWWLTFALAGSALLVVPELRRVLLRRRR